MLVLFLNLFDQSYVILIVFTNPHNQGVDVFNCLVIKDNPIERHNFYGGTNLHIFFCNTPDHPNKVLPSSLTLKT